jgi:predicted glycosyltransferase
LVLAGGVARRAHPGLLLSTSRSAAMASRLLRVPSFMVLDYEHAELSSFRLAGTTVLYPDVIEASVFHAKGFRPDRLLPFAGIKEDISFARRDLERVEAHSFGVENGGLAVVLVRPPSETSHYFTRESRTLSDDVLARLAVEPSVRVVYSPRDPAQLQHLEAHQWVNQPIVLERAVEFVSLLKAVDWVVCSGGTMLREAAYVGVPAISTFRSEVGAVDRMLERIGAVRTVNRAEDLDAIDWRRTRKEKRVPRHPEVVEHLTDQMLGRVRA